MTFKERLTMDYTPFLEGSKTKELSSPTHMQSLYLACQQILDGRKARGRRSDPAGVLVVMVLAKRAGRSSLLAVSEWGKDQETMIRTNLGFNEVGVLKPLLTEIVCLGRVITADAAQSSHEMTRLLKRAGGEVILIIKDNTPLARADLELFFEDEQADRSTWQS
jgi:hypothetical protein